MASHATQPPYVVCYFGYLSPTQTFTFQWELAAGAEPEQALVAGRLVEREEERRIEARAAWPRTWRKLRKAI